MKMRPLLFGLFLLAASLGAPSAVYAASISVSVSLSSVAQGSALPISWTSQSAPAGATVSLSLIPLPDREWATIGANKPLIGTMSWTVPSTYCHLDVCGLPLTPGQYLVRAFIVSGGQALATGDSSDFSVTARVATTTAAPACSLSLSSRSVVYGNYLTLSWTSQRATAGTITGVDGTVGPIGSVRVNPGTSGTYTGVFTGPGGTGRCSVSVAVTTAATGGTTIGFPEATFRGVPEVYQNVGTDQTPGQTQTPVQSTPEPTRGDSGVNGLVGCNGAASCNLCAFTGLFQRVINFLIGLTVPLSALLFAWAGILYFSSGANPSQTEKAKKIFFSVAIGLVIAMGGWLGIQTLLKTVLAPGYYKDWNSIDCRQAPGSRPMSGLVKDWLSFLPQLNPNALTQNVGYTSGINTPDTAVDFSTGCRAGAGLVNGQCYDDFGGVYDPVFNPSTGCQSGDYLSGGGQCMGAFGNSYNPYTVSSGSSGAYGSCASGYTYTENAEEYWCQGPGGEDDFRDVLPRTAGGSVAGTQQWISQIEAACAQNPNFGNCVQISQGIMAAESGGRTAVVSPAGAYGIMQMLPGTARQMDPSGTAGMSDSQIAQMLLNNPTYAINLGVGYAAQMNSQFGGSCELTAAAYNGGPRANNSSSTCPGQRYWQCSSNRGYQETRNYVPRVCGS